MIENTEHGMELKEVKERYFRLHTQEIADSTLPRPPFPVNSFIIK
jgi:hypothetical protein